MSGSAVLLDQEGQGGNPPNRQESQQQQRNQPPAVELVDEPARTGPTPEEALAASQKAIARAEESSRGAQQREQAAQQELARVRQSQQQDQAAVLASAVEASTAERDRHAHAWQSAMEAGDFPAASKHQADMMMATAKLERATGELAVVKAGADQRQRQGGQPQQQQGVSTASQHWINSHKDFNSHKDALILKHQELINDGVVIESPRYFRELDAEYDRLTNNGQHAEGGAQRDMVDNRRQQQQHFDGASPSRGGAGGTQGNTVQTLMGPVSVRVVNGQTMLQIPAHLRADFDEGAKVVGMSTADYAMEQVKIARERAAGGTGGLVGEEGKTYR
jgi:hypothetical protein